MNTVKFPFKLSLVRLSQYVGSLINSLASSQESSQIKNLKHTSIHNKKINKI
jgi:hypothetical protein